MPYQGFAAVKASAKAGGARNPGAVAAAAGRKKYGKKAFQKHAAAGTSMEHVKPLHKKGSGMTARHAAMALKERMASHGE
jgi:hypothetical protein